MVKRKTTDIITLPHSFNRENYHGLCDHLAALDEDLKAILDAHGYPPMWTRNNSFETLVHIILEQQVSLASALAALNKLKERLKEITPETVLELNEEEMKACYVSRQKAGYIKGLALAIKQGVIDLNALPGMSDDEVRETLIQLKGIGHWTIDVYLMFVLQRVNIFPIGDLAAVNAVKRLKKLMPKTPKDAVLEITERWKPLRSVASMMLWHYYLSNPKK